MNTINVPLGKLGQVKLEAYYPYVLAAYAQRGSVHTSQIEKEILERMKPLFTDVDYALTAKHKQVRCENNAHQAILDVAWFGYIIKRAPALYSLTVAGRAALQTGLMYQSHDNGPIHELKFTLV